MLSKSQAEERRPLPAAARVSGMGALPCIGSGAQRCAQHGG